METVEEVLREESIEQSLHKFRMDWGPVTPPTSTEDSKKGGRDWPLAFLLPLGMIFGRAHCSGCVSPVLLTKCGMTSCRQALGGGVSHSPDGLFARGRSGGPPGADRP